MKRKNSIFFSVFIGIVVFVIGILCYKNWYIQKLATINANDDSAADSIRQDVARRIAICKSTSKALSTLTELYLNNNDTDINFIENNFSKIAEAVDNKYGSMNRMQLTKNNVVQKVYPDTAENRKSMLNVDLNSRIPKDRITLFKNSNKCFVSAPIATTSGWKGIVIRNSIFKKDKNNQGVFWGSASVMIKIDDFVKQLKLNNLNSNKMDYHLYITDSNTKINTMLASSNSRQFKNQLMKNVVTFDNTNSLVLELEDDDKDALTNYNPLMIALIFIFSVIVGTTVFLFLYQREILINKAKKNAYKLKEAKEYDRLKTEFFANISHEFRTPINIILSAIKMFEIYMPEDKKDKNIGKIIEYKNIVKKNCYRLLRIIGNLIDVTKLDVNFLELNPVKVNIVSLIEDITLSVAEYCESKSVQLIFDTDTEEKYTMCDPDKIDRIMLNLLSNAIKFTNKGDKIEVDIFDKNDYVEVAVKDTGIGIPKNKQKMIFERFRQVNKSLSREHEGSGIGLSLVKSLVEMHGGKINLASEENIGSKFIFTLPVILENGSEANTESINSNVSTNLVETIKIEFSDLF